MKKFLYILAVTIGMSVVAQAQIDNESLEKSRNYKAQNNQLSPGSDDPIFEGVKSPSTIELADASYKNQFKSTKAKKVSKDDMILVPGKVTNDTGFYAAGYSKSGFHPTQRQERVSKSTPVHVSTSPGVVNEKTE